MNQSQKPEIIRSLGLGLQIFKECGANYRIVGSMLVTSYIQRLFRRVGDIDVLLDNESFSCVLKKLENAGYTLHKKHWGMFTWFEAEKEDCLGFTFLLVGKFTKNDFRYTVLPYCELRIRASYLRPTEYSFNGTPFIGIPLTSILAGIRRAFLNPKRKLDQHVLKEKLGRLDFSHSFNNIQVYLFGIKIPYLYDIFSFMYNVYGGLRVAIGKKYEAWE